MRVDDCACTAREDVNSVAEVQAVELTAEDTSSAELSLDAFASFGALSEADRYVWTRTFLDQVPVAEGGGFDMWRERSWALLACFVRMHALYESAPMLRFGLRAGDGAGSGAVDVREFWNRVCARLAQINDGGALLEACRQMREDCALFNAYAQERGWEGARVMLPLMDVETCPDRIRDLVAMALQYMAVHQGAQLSQ